MPDHRDAGNGVGAQEDRFLLAIADQHDYWLEKLGPNTRVSWHRCPHGSFSRYLDSEDIFEDAFLKILELPDGHLEDEAAWSDCGRVLLIATHDFHVQYALVLEGSKRGEVVACIGTYIDVPTGNHFLDWYEDWLDRTISDVKRVFSGRRDLWE
jgi:hypothetical protein